MTVGATLARGSDPAISFVINAKHATDISLNRLITFGTPLALLKCVAGCRKSNPSRKKVKQNETFTQSITAVGRFGRNIRVCRCTESNHPGVDAAVSSQ
jgi:hypothetical protein